MPREAARREVVTRRAAAPPFSIRRVLTATTSVATFAVNAPHRGCVNVISVVRGAAGGGGRRPRRRPRAASADNNCGCQIVNAIATPNQTEGDCDRDQFEIHV
ncbi:hypothetical protein MSG28_001776 [Choristoneura fumiferana]|uniref:Uncharacterized protein n=1 Tax=Choristoneura fumiferana TaxID=7141 RepID=A0ACC0KW46_CHOFU|nr:hypothetical protein MSG28_001776 [Choristoneura fumiferana]